MRISLESFCCTLVILCHIVCDALLDELAPVSTIAFGSCNRQNRPQTHWEIISSFQPSYFLWTGDAVYAKGRHNVSRMIDAYRNLTANPAYDKFSAVTPVDGIWDDHDYGVNDGGRDVSDRNIRQAAYLNFLLHHQADRDTSHLSALADQDGLYHSRDITLRNGMVLKVIFLDTRSHRDQHFLRSLGEYEVKGSAIVASALRALYTVMGMGRKYSGKVLGEAQWTWLNETLRSSTADAHAIVSSIQVLTSNPVTEAWGHFPIEQKKLMDLLQQTDPLGLFFISGDVHLAEMSAATYRRVDGSLGQWVEVTSSGLTHTCADGIFNSFLCPLMTAIFSLHRRSPDALFLGRNFGLIESSPEVTPTSQGRWLDINLQSLEKGYDTVNSYRLPGNSLSQDRGKISPIDSVQYPHLAVLPPGIRRFIFIMLVALLYVYLVRTFMRKGKGVRFDMWGRRKETAHRSRRRSAQKSD